MSENPFLALRLPTTDEPKEIVLARLRAEHRALSSEIRLLSRRRERVVKRISELKQDLKESRA